MYSAVTCGIPGGKISNSQHIRKLEQLLQTYTPRLLVINIGGNDLDQVDFKASDIELIVLRYVHILNLFAQLYSVKIAPIQRDILLQTFDVRTAKYKDIRHCLHFTI
jgi:lysophospholipase L1-like esterase